MKKIILSLVATFMAVSAFAHIVTITLSDGTERVITTSQLKSINVDGNKITAVDYYGNIIEGLNNISASTIVMDDKARITEIITEYNKSHSEEQQIEYTDFIALLMSSVSTIINAITYILIAFVAISLVVSSIMIGIITYISVLERTKEIGILRSIGASKRDISRVFNAETMIIGFVSGALGILVTVLLNIPINIIIKKITDISRLSRLPILGAIILIAISILLTLIAGLIPSRIAAKKDPVTALRSE